MRSQAVLEYAIILTLIFTLYILFFKNMFFFALDTMYRSSFLSTLKLRLNDVLAFYAIRYDIGQFPFFEPEILTYHNLNVTNVSFSMYPVNDYCFNVKVKITVKDEKTHQTFNITSQEITHVCGHQICDLIHMVCNNIIFSRKFYGYYRIAYAKEVPGFMGQHHFRFLCNYTKYTRITIKSPIGTKVYNWSDLESYESCDKKIKLW